MRFLSNLFYLTLILLERVQSEKLTNLCFEPPYKDLNSAGERVVSNEWRTAGAAVVNNNFVRVVPDRQSQKGALWSRHAVAARALSVIMKFRIAGKAKQFYGDGLAFWLVTQGYYSEGNLHGFHDRFTGIGIIFDTFKNMENLHAHRDVTVLVNDGTKTYEMMTETVEGCHIGVRYDTTQATFDVQKSMSRMKFLATENSIDIFIDAKNTGEWSRCVKLDNLELPNGWLPHAHIGLSASTGQLADNHDVISLLAYSEAYVMEKDLEIKSIQKFFEVAPVNSTVDERIVRIERAVNDIYEKLDFYDHHTEHEFVTIEDKLDALDARLESIHPENNQDNTHDENRILTAKELDTYKLKFADIDATLELLKSTKTTGGGGGGSGDWKLPFTLLTLLVLGSMGGMYVFYLHIAKKWKLP